MNRTAIGKNLCCLAVALLMMPPMAAADGGFVIDTRDLVWTDESPLAKLDPDIVAMMEARYPGWIVVDAAQGSFTARNAEQVAVMLIDHPPLLTTPARVHETMISVLDEDDTTDFTLPFPAVGFGPVIAGLSDTGDGVVMVNWFMRQGIESYDIGIVAFDKEEVTTLHRFDAAVVTNCGPEGSGFIEGAVFTLHQDGGVETTGFRDPCAER